MANSDPGKKPGSGPHNVYWHGSLRLAAGPLEPVVIRQVIANHVMLECAVGAKAGISCAVVIQVPAVAAGAPHRPVSIEGQVLQSSFSQEHFKLIIDIKQITDEARALLVEGLGHAIS